MKKYIPNIAMGLVILLFILLLIVIWGTDKSLPLKGVCTILDIFIVGLGYLLRTVILGMEE